MKKLVGRPPLNEPRPYPCGCGKAFMTTSGLYKHYKSKHPLPEGPPKGSYVKKNIGHPLKNKALNKKRFCGCGEVYSNVKSLWAHIKNKHKGIAPPKTLYFKAGRPKK